jgi:hypothetical protein
MRQQPSTSCMAAESTARKSPESVIANVSMEGAWRQNAVPEVRNTLPFGRKRTISVGPRHVAYVTRTVGKRTYEKPCPLRTPNVAPANAGVLQ